MTPQGATHQLRQGFKRLDHPTYIIWSDKAGESKEWHESEHNERFNKWVPLYLTTINLELYEPITEVDSNNEDACFKAIEMRNACNELL